MTTPDDLIALSRRLGEPEAGLAILGEGNTSCRLDEEQFLVKASGCTLNTASSESFVAVRFAPVLALLEEGEVDETRLAAIYHAAKADADDPRRPSVETIFHAWLLSLPGVQVVAHTHPVVVNALTCSQAWPDCCRGRLFPDEAVVCGPEAVLVPYIDPGVALARALRSAVDAYRARHDSAVPKQILMQNHGLIAVADDAEEACSITRMAVKAAAIRAGALASGGIRDLGTAVTRHLLERPDEKYRQTVLGGHGEA